MLPPHLQSRRPKDGAAAVLKRGHTGVRREDATRPSLRVLGRPAMPSPVKTAREKRTDKC